MAIRFYSEPQYTLGRGKNFILWRLGIRAPEKQDGAIWQRKLIRIHSILTKYKKTSELKSTSMISSERIKISKVGKLCQRHLKVNYMEKFLYMLDCLYVGKGYIR